jgi:hypothetical protein
MEEKPDKAVVGQFVEFLRRNQLGNTEEILMKEFETSLRNHQPPKNPARSSSQLPPLEKSERPEKAERPEKVERSERAERSEKPEKEVRSEAPRRSGADGGRKKPDDEEPAGESEEVNVVNFEASLAEQLKQVVNDIGDKPAYVSGLLSHQIAAPKEDTWTGPDDLGFARIPATPGAEASEVIEDEEHRRHLPPYLEQVKPLNLKKKATRPASDFSSARPQGDEDEEDEDGEMAPPPADPEPIDEAPAEDPSSQDDGPAPQSLEAPDAKAQSSSVAVAAAVVAPVPKHPHGSQQYTQYDSEHGKRSKTQPTVYEAFDLKVIYEVHRTGFEEHKDYPIRMHAIIAGRYQILEYLGSAAFSRAVQCVDLKNGQLVCVKIIRNNKDFFDQGLDEIKLLQYINSAGDANENCVLQLYDYFYHKEHLFLVCELLRDNLYEFSKYNRESGDDPYFTLPRLQRITRQVLTALRFVHRLNLVHCDLKPENILIKSYSRCEVKVIDFGSTCFTTDHLSTYVQSRCYRAPEVILGLPYTQKIDLWSLGAILAELYSGRVLFHNDSVQTMMARILAICGPVPPHMLRSGRYVNRFFTRQHRLFERNKTTGTMNYLQPRRCSLRHRLGQQADDLFVDFVETLLTVDPANRPTAAEALQHPWLHQEGGAIQ